MNEAKVQLSKDELWLVQNADWLLTKNKIIQKVIDLFGELSNDIHAIIKSSSIDPALLTASPKISKGENYKGLPYVMLDYPRSFGRDDVFAIRNMFWWGNFFSVTLHIKGTHKNSLLLPLKKNIHLLKQNNFYISTSNDEWNHDFEKENYVLLDATDDVSLENYLTAQPFCKFATRIPLNNWDNVKADLCKYYVVLLKSTCLIA